MVLLLGNHPIFSRLSRKRERRPSKPEAGSTPSTEKTEGGEVWTMSRRGRADAWEETR